MAQTLSTILGNTVPRYCITIGLYLASMGVGAMLCQKRDKRRSISMLIKVEIALTVIGGLSVISINAFDVLQKILYESGAVFDTPLFLKGSLAEIIFFILSHGVIALIGILSGFEIPLLIQISESEKPSTTNKVLGIDYFGSLAGSVIFPLVLLPFIGLFSAAFIVAMLNGIAAMAIVIFKRPSKIAGYAFTTVILIGILITGFFNSDNIKRYYLKKFYFYYETIEEREQNSQDNHKIESWTSKYQQIDLVTRADPEESVDFFKIHSTKFDKNPDFPPDKWLFLNGMFQFYSLVEEIYHEYFVHVPIQLTHIPKRVAILGGGDGLVAREILKYKQIKDIIQVEIDDKMIDLAKNHPIFKKINGDSFNNPRVTIINENAFIYLRNNMRFPDKKFDAIYIDFPSPSDFNLATLYSEEFYTLVYHNLSSDGFAVADIPNGEPEHADSDGYFKIYYASVTNAGFDHVFPIQSKLETDNPQAVKKYDPDMIESQIDDTFQVFLFMGKEDKVLNSSYKDYGIKTHVLNEKRFLLSMEVQYPRIPELSLVNSIYKPNIPTFRLFNIYFPY
jgi:spermidine synthase